MVIIKNPQHVLNSQTQNNSVNHSTKCQQLKLLKLTYLKSKPLEQKYLIFIKVAENNAKNNTYYVDTLYIFKIILYY